MKPLTLTVIKIKLSPQLLVEVSKSQQGLSQQCWSDSQQMNSVEMNSRAELGLQVSCVLTAARPASMRMQDLSSELAGVKGASQEVPSAPVHAVQRHIWCAQAEAVSGSTSDSQPDQDTVGKALFRVSTWCPTAWTCNLCTLYCQVPCYCGDGSSSELITCDWIKHFIPYLLLERTEFGSSVWDAEPLTIQILSFALSAIKIRTKGKNLFHVATKDPIFIATGLRQHSVFFQATKNSIFSSQFSREHIKWASSFHQWLTPGKAISQIVSPFQRKQAVPSYITQVAADKLKYIKSKAFKMH